VRFESWRPVALLAFSAVVHAGAVAAIAVDRALWPWAVAAIVINHLLFAAATLSPRGQWFGPNRVRMDAAAAVCLTFDDGPHPDITPRVLELLDRYGAKASFFCIGERAAIHPEIVKDIARRGHSVENHSYRHIHSFAFLGRGRLREEVERAQAAMERITGRRPEFFRAPAGFRSILLAPVLAEQRLTYVSWTRRGYDGVSDDAKRILERLLRNLQAGDVLLLHDSREVVLKVLPALLEELRRRKLRCVTLAAARASGGPPRSF
jgi:peptidoglycan-N-acetylglucosamine deacetylase